MRGGRGRKNLSFFVGACSCRRSCRPIASRPSPLTPPAFFCPLPLQVLGGRHDPICPAERFPNEMKDARLVWVPQCGHVAHLERPQFITDEVRPF